MRTTVKTEGIDKLTRNIAAVDKKFASDLQELIDSTAQVLRTEIIRSIQRSPATGRAYPKGKDAIHRASSAGNPPRTDEGELVRMITARVKQHEAEVTSTAPYSANLEFGTSKMAARPFMFPAFERQMVGFRRKLAELMKKVGNKL